MGKLKVFILLIAGIAVASWVGLEVYADNRAEKKLNALLTDLDLENRVKYADIDYSLISGELLVEKITVSSPRGDATIERLRVHRYTDSEATIYVEGIRFSDDEFINDMKELGYDDPRINLSFDASIDDENRMLDVRNFSFEMPGGFRLSFRFLLTNIDSDLLRKLSEFDGTNREQLNREQLNELSDRVAKVKVSYFETVLSDLGIRDKIIKAEAKKQGKGEEEIRRKIVGDMEKSLKKAKSEFEKKLVQSVKSFIEKGGLVRITLKPETPVEFQELIFTLMLSAQTKDLKPFVERFKAEVSHEL